MNTSPRDGVSENGKDRLALRQCKSSWSENRFVARHGSPQNMSGDLYRRIDEDVGKEKSPTGRHPRGECCERLREVVLIGQVIEDIYACDEIEELALDRVAQAVLSGRQIELDEDVGGETSSQPFDRILGKVESHPALHTELLPQPAVGADSHRALEEIPGIAMTAAEYPFGSPKTDRVGDLVVSTPELRVPHGVERSSVLLVELPPVGFSIVVQC